MSFQDCWEQNLKANKVKIYVIKRNIIIYFYLQSCEDGTEVPVIKTMILIDSLKGRWIPLDILLISNLWGSLECIQEVRE